MLRYALPLLLLVLAIGCGGAPNPPTYPPPPPGAGGNQPPRDAKTQRPAPPKPAEQKPPTPQEQLDRTMAELSQRLALKPAQKAPVRDILAQEQARREQIRSAQASTTNVQTMIRLFEVLRQAEQETEAKLAKVLSKDQLEAYQKWRKEQRKRLEALGGPVKSAPPMRGMGGSRPGGPGGR